MRPINGISLKVLVCSEYLCSGSDTLYQQVVKFWTLILRRSLQWSNITFPLEPVPNVAMVNSSPVHVKIDCVNFSVLVFPHCYLLIRFKISSGDIEFDLLWLISYIFTLSLSYQRRKKYFIENLRGSYKIENTLSNHVL